MKRAAIIASSCALVMACAERHEVTGLVLKIDQASRTLTVSHEPIPGYMDAMVMPFTAVRASEIAGVQPGDRIKFRMNVGRRETTVDRVKILSAAPANSETSATRSERLVAIGEPVPDIALVNQNRVPVTLHELRGRVVVVSFIYTRCPLPDYCPRVMTNLTSLRDRFRAQLDTSLVLLTVTFDPQHDTPEKLKAYADRYGADVPGWHFLTGTRDETTRAATLLGVEFYPEEGVITHTLQTAVITRDGRLAARAEGREFSTRQLGDLVELHLPTPAR
jgi:protein SCO1